KEASIDKDGIQRVIEKGNDLQEAIMAKLKELSISNQFADEEVKSSYGYPAGYRPKPLEEQISILRGYWPKLDPSKQIIELERKPLISGAEALFAIVHWQTLAPTYGDALEKEVFPAIKTQRKGKFYNYREGNTGPQYLRQHERTAQKFQVLNEQQKNCDILVVPAQFGLRHRDRSARRAREVFTANEFGLGAFAAGIMLLTYLERLVSYGDLWIDCPGDEYCPNAGGQFASVPYFRFRDDGVGFGTRWSGLASGSFGSVSAFLPQ
ncbi:hypothetical protein ISS21_00870, partial [Patescibacteria group bacterium]|nr:hypothetical protein [Patescibacteria group bacterium]